MGCRRFASVFFRALVPDHSTSATLPAMNTETILERLRQKPFRPFVLETVDGTWFEVDRDIDVLVYDRVKPVRIVIFDSNGRMYVLEPEQIFAIEVR